MKYTTKLKAGSFLLSSLLLASTPLYASDSKSNSRILPIWGDEARAMGYELPEPFGVSASYMTMKQEIKVKEINFADLELVPSTLLPEHTAKIDELISSVLTSELVDNAIHQFVRGDGLANMILIAHDHYPDQVEAGVKDQIKQNVGSGIIQKLAFRMFMDAIKVGHETGDTSSLEGLLKLGGLDKIEKAMKEGKDQVNWDLISPLIGDKTLPLPQTLFNITVGETKQRSHTENLRFDTWVLPFMNIYGILGQTKGHSISKVDVKIDSKQLINGNLIPAEYQTILKEMMEKGIITQDLLRELDNLTKQPGSLLADINDIDFRLDFKGKTYGGGMTLAGGTGNFFALLDANYTWTRFDVLDGDIKAFTIAPRIGYRFTTPSWEAINLKPGKLNVWVGSMYQDIQQDFRGSLDNLRMPPELTQLIAMADGKHNGRFQVKQELKKPWNILLGARYEMTPNFALTTELGFEDRKSFFVSGEFRF